MGWVADVSSLCLDCKGKREQKTKSKKEVSKRVSFNHREKSKGYAHWKDKAKLKVTYSSLSGKCRMGSCLPLTASCSAGRSSFYRWPRSGRLRHAGRLGLTGGLKFDGTFLDWHVDIYDFNLLLPT